MTEPVDITMDILRLIQADIAGIKADVGQIKADVLEIKRDIRVIEGDLRGIRGRVERLEDGDRARELATKS